MEQTLVAYLRTVPDFRSAYGKRYQLDHLLLMIIFGMMSGCYGYRELGTFVKANRSELVALFGLNG
ncbi:MAG: transposase family protein, partial [Chlorobi bacterium]|nr:transposase family protein [Chlorobiota bacterium]